MKAKEILISLRIRQWIKNSFIFVPLVFSGQASNPGYFLACTLGFIYLSLLSSALYLINDLFDAREDRLHPAKSRRPIAQGRITPATALTISALLLVFSMVGISAMQNTYFLAIALGYIILNILYNLAVKHMVILDVISIALGFELRVWAGAVIVHMAPSEWLQVCVFLLALFLGFAKRREEIFLLKDGAWAHRKVLVHYNLAFLDQLIVLCAGAAILGYALYTLSYDVLKRPQGKFMIYSTPFVAYGILRYLYLVYAHKRGGDAAELFFSDRPLLLNLLLWCISIVLILYLR